MCLLAYSTKYYASVTFTKQERKLGMYNYNPFQLFSPKIFVVSFEVIVPL